MNLCWMNETWYQMESPWESHVILKAEANWETTGMVKNTIEEFSDRWKHDCVISGPGCGDDTGLDAYLRLNRMLRFVSFRVNSMGRLGTGMIGKGMRLTCSLEDNDDGCHRRPVTTHLTCSYTQCQSRGWDCFHQISESSGGSCCAPSLLWSPAQEGQEAL